MNNENCWWILTKGWLIDEDRVGVRIIDDHLIVFVPEWSINTVVDALSKAFINIFQMKR